MQSYVVDVSRRKGGGAANQQHSASYCIKKKNKLFFLKAVDLAGSQDLVWLTKTNIGLGQVQNQKKDEAALREIKYSNKL